ncbi:MAG: transcriptional regulator [Streptosporangiales bacterium]|nr:transcriptional regulator [Streptosporangiales bacterium]
MLGWVERIAKYCADTDGLPLIAGRILGWLTVCDPPEQSAAEIAEAIGASRASLTTNLRLLSSVGFLSQLTKPGNRTVYYQVDDDAWEKVVQRQVESLTSLGEIMRDGMELVGGSQKRGARIRAAHEVFGWLDKVFANAPPLPSAGRANRTQKEK